MSVLSPHFGADNMFKASAPSLRANEAEMQHLHFSKRLRVDSMLCRFAQPMPVKSIAAAR
jgi:hypothetical protein